MIDIIGDMGTSWESMVSNVCPLVICYSLPLKMAIEIVSFPRNSMVISRSCVSNNELTMENGMIWAITNYHCQY